MIKVNLMLRKGRKCYECQWRDPDTDKLCTQTTGTSRKRDAERFAGRLQEQLNSGTFQRSSRSGWAEAADRYEAENRAGVAKATLEKWKGTRHKVEVYINPSVVKGIDEKRLGELTAGLRSERMAEDSVKSHLATLRAMLNWCQRQGLIKRVPHFEMPQRVGRAKGRPITGDEFQRMLDVTPAIVGNENAPHWTRFLRALWWSGLRLSEAVELRWNDGPLAISMSGERPRLFIDALADKSGKPRILPLAPEFCEMLQAVPPAERTGKLFRLPMLYSEDLARKDSISKVICAIGLRAGVVVAERDGKKKHASAHDLRRSFGTRWASRVLPQQLRELMRHDSINTTMTFYAHLTADAVESVVWSNVATPANISANTEPVPQSD